MVKLRMKPSRLLPAQMTAFIILSFFFINAILCYESSGSSELNRLEFGPLYETIIYSDIADIIKDYENNVNSPIEAFINNDDNSDSDENVDDLLSEYQHYLDKAHKQRKNYVEKSRMKNKISLLQRDKYPKSHAAPLNKQDYYDIKYYNPTAFPLPKSQFNSPFDFLLPMNMMRSDLPFVYEEPPKLTVEPVNEIPILPIEKIIPEPKLLSLPPVMPSSMRESIHSSCYCKADTFPCECGCKQCLIAFEPMRKPTDYEKSQKLPPPKTTITNSSYNDARNSVDNTINIRIKVDVQFPQYQNDLQNLEEKLKNNSNDRADRGILLKESYSPMPLFNFPFPLEMFGFKKSNRNSAPIHKITIHRKKKSKSGSNGKRHRKKFVTFHDLNVERHSMQPSLDEIYNMTDYRPKLDDNNQINETNHFPQKSEPESSDKSTYWTTKLPSVNESKTDDNTTDDPPRNDNSIETDYTGWITSVSTAEPSLRDKREVPSPTTSTDKLSKALLVQNNSSSLTNDTVKKSSKSLPDDNELLYWPNNTKDVFMDRHIDNLILDGNNKTLKLNFSTEMIRDNRTKIIEETLFGRVNWNDVDTVAPAVMSFIGKYMTGVLSFCSDSKCYSMKCEEKICVYRTCAPTDRTNNRGHCVGLNAPDSVIFMESINDSPSNVVLGIVDILENKLSGKLFGKATLCITSKCITFTASKKNFSRLKCNSKELNAIGHCPVTKNMKIM